ncbi:MAG: glycosyltransferase family 2 protein [Bdellovibrionales bacterium]|nr:glycosyltransferase family 2 protein [Bdellovibrionales bacterium]
MIKEFMIRQYLKFFPPKISIIVLSWNRLSLLRTTVLSLIATTKIPFEITIVDNNSDKPTLLWLEKIEEEYSFIRVIYQTKNKGGESINDAFEYCQNEYILISENDIEYFPGWERKMLLPFYIDNFVGQVSPFSPFPEESFGEDWVVKKHTTTDHNLFYWANQNLGTTCLVKKSTVTKGAHFKSLSSKDSEICFPSDAEFSNAISKLGLKLVWLKDYCAINWGHNKYQIDEHKEYYNKNIIAKSEFNIDGLSKNESLNLNELNDRLRRKDLEIFSLYEKLKYIKKLNFQHENLSEVLNIKEYSSLFVDLGSGFTPENCYFNPLNLENDNFSIQFNFNPAIEGVYNLRWDPVEGALCNLEINQILLNGKAILPKIKANTKSVNANRFEFKTTDPSITFPIDQKQIKSLHFNGKIKIFY